MILMILWCVLLSTVAFIWASRHHVISRAQRELLPLTERFQSNDPDITPMISVLIAAKDEQDNIEKAVRTILDQDYPKFELIVINDRSTDRTAEILETIRDEQTNGCLKVIHVKQLRDGWFGKNNAMREGIEHAKGEWYCFGDADCRQTSKRSLAVAMQYALSRKIDFLSVLPQLEMHSIWERIIQPVCGAVMVFWFHPERVNDPSRVDAYANGAFMLMSKRCYEAVGGHNAVRTEVNEDMHLARLAKEHHQRLYVIQNDGLYQVRMYTGFRQIWRGWSRIFFGCFGTFRRLRITMLMLLATNIFPYGSLLIAACVCLARGWAHVETGWHWVLGLSTLVVILHQSVIARYYKLSKVHPAWAPTFIIGAVICIGMLGSAMLRLKGRAVTTWRGTTYRGKQIVK